MPRPLHIALDGNEANVLNRVGSNVYAFEVLRELYERTHSKTQYSCTVLLAQAPIAELPKPRSNWRYRVIKPKRLWTQWALPLHLFWHQKKYDVLFTPGHYAPRFSPIPYVSSVMDLAFLHYPEQFQKNDLFQLKHWTRYSVARAAKIITISEFSKVSVQKHYHRKAEDIIVAPPAVSLPPKHSPLRFGAFLRKYGITENNYFLYLGTLQPRKNIEKLIEAFEIFCRFEAASHLQKKTGSKKSLTKNAPQLVIAGKTGWLSDGIQKRAAASTLKKQIIFTGFVDENIKKPLYEHARASALIGLYEGFGIPPLESLNAGTLPIVSNTSSLPEVVGELGWQVDPRNAHEIADALKQAWNIPDHQRKRLAKQAIKQAAHFSWKKTGKIILKTLKAAAKRKTHHA